MQQSAQFVQDKRNLRDLCASFVRGTAASFLHIARSAHGRGETNCLFDGLHITPCARHIPASSDGRGSEASFVRLRIRLPFEIKTFSVGRATARMTHKHTAVRKNIPVRTSRKSNRRVRRHKRQPRRDGLPTKNYIRNIAEYCKKLPAASQMLTQTKRHVRPSARPRKQRRYANRPLHMPQGKRLCRRIGSGWYATPIAEHKSKLFPPRHVGHTKICPRVYG